MGDAGVAVAHRSDNRGVGDGKEKLGNIFYL